MAERSVLAHHASRPRLALVAVVVLGLCLRVVAAFRLALHTDEPVSILAAQQVRIRGLPLLPSGMPYFQGATVSYLLSPIASLDHLVAMRCVLAVISLATIVIVHRLTLGATGSAWAGVLAAGIVAVDPMLVEWGVRVRMYALSLVLVPLFVLLATELLRGRRAPVVVLGTIVVYWLCVFTSSLTGLVLVPLLAFGVVRAVRRSVDRWTLAGVVLGCAAAPIALVGLNRLLRPSSLSTAGARLPTFVGDNLLSTRHLTAPNTDALVNVFGPGSLRPVLPLVMAALVAVASGRCLRPDVGRVRSRRQPVLSLGFCLSVYVAFVVVVTLFISLPVDRYLVAAQPLAYVVAVAAIYDLVAVFREPGRSAPLGRQRARALLGLGALSLIVASAVSGYPAVRPKLTRSTDRQFVASWIRERRTDGQPVIVTTPAPAAVGLGSSKDLWFLPGPEGGPRAAQYSFPAGDGRRLDYWTGSPTITSATGVCRLLVQHPDTWLLLDRPRSWLGPELNLAISRLMEPVYDDGRFGTAFRPVPDVAALAQDPTTCPPRDGG